MTCALREDSWLVWAMRPVWSKSSLSAWRNFGSLATHRVPSKDSDQTGQMGTVRLLVLSCCGSYMEISPHLSQFPTFLLSKQWITNSCYTHIIKWGHGSALSTIVLVPVHMENFLPRDRHHTTENAFLQWKKVQGSPFITPAKPQSIPNLVNYFLWNVFMSNIKMLFCRI